MIICAFKHLLDGGCCTPGTYLVRSSPFDAQSSPCIACCAQRISAVPVLGRAGSPGSVGCSEPLAPSPAGAKQLGCCLFLRSSVRIAHPSAQESHHLHVCSSGWGYASLKSFSLPHSPPWLKWGKQSIFASLALLGCSGTERGQAGKGRGQQCWQGGAGWEPSRWGGCSPAGDAPLPVDREAVCCAALMARTWKERSFTLALSSASCTDSCRTRRRFTKGPSQFDVFPFSCASSVSPVLQKLTLAGPLWQPRRH